MSRYDIVLICCSVFVVAGHSNILAQIEPIVIVMVTPVAIGEDEHLLIDILRFEFMVGRVIVIFQNLF